MPHAAVPNSASPRFERWAIALVVLVVLAMYLPRLTTLPVRGEESRWATEAREMVRTGDWIVPRQQGQVFPERPPLGSWLMAAGGFLRGEVDLWAIRLPSVLAILLTSLIIYKYSRQTLSVSGALAAALAYPSMGQVWQLGRFGESEAVFTLGLGGALLAWHACWHEQRRPTAAWCLGYGLAALGALTKGPQAPVYFLLVTGGWLVLSGEWRSLFASAHALGLGLFGLLVGSWWLALWQATDLTTARIIWTGLAGDRFLLSGLLSHLLSYPFETLACTMPWSLVALVLLDRRVRADVLSAQPRFRYLLWALAVTYPTVLFAAGARGRYFMPLYPLAAVLAGMVVHQYVSCPSPVLRHYWRRATVTLAIGILAAGVALWAASNLEFAGPPGLFSSEWRIDLLTGFSLMLGVLLFRLRTAQDARRVTAAVACLTLFLGLVYCGPLVDMRLATSNDLRPGIREIRGALPQPDRLVSFGPIAHRFAYEFGAPIPELPWPTSAQSVPSDLEYFCFDEHPGDTAERRFNGRGRFWGSTPGSLPFAWEQVARIPCDPHQRREHDVTVVIGRVQRPATLARVPSSPAP